MRHKSGCGRGDRQIRLREETRVPLPDVIEE